MVDSTPQHKLFISGWKTIQLDHSSQGKILVWSKMYLYPFFFHVYMFKTNRFSEKSLNKIKHHQVHDIPVGVSIHKGTVKSLNSVSNYPILTYVKKIIFDPLKKSKYVEI